MDLPTFAGCFIVDVGLPGLGGHDFHAHLVRLDRPDALAHEIHEDPDAVGKVCALEV